MKRIISVLLISMFLLSAGAIYAADGDMLVGTTYDSTRDDLAWTVATDSFNNAIVTGYITNSSGNFDYYTIKYDPNGNVIWAKPYDGGSDDYGYSVATDSNNNVIVTGMTTYSGNGDWYTIKYDPNGNVIWANRYNHGYGVDIAYAVTTDSNNNIIVTGTVYTAAGNLDYYTIKYGPSGNLIWGKSYDSTYGHDYGRGVTTDLQNNIIVTGYGNSTVNTDYYTIKYDSNGNFLWVKRYDGGYGNDYGRGVVSDSSNNIIVTGYILNNASNYDYYIIKYDANGNLVWAKTYDSTRDDYSFGIARDSYNNIIVTGQVRNASGNHDYYTIKYDANGNLVWAKTYDSTRDDIGVGVTTDSYNFVIVTGWVNNGSNTDYYTIKYQGVPPVKKSYPMLQILKILKIKGFISEE